MTWDVTIRNINRREKMSAEVTTSNAHKQVRNNLLCTMTRGGRPVISDGKDTNFLPFGRIFLLMCEKVCIFATTKPHLLSTKHTTLLCVGASCL